MTIAAFERKYTGRVLEDAGAYVSDEFKQFAKDMRSALKQEAKKYGLSLCSWHVGHYDVSGFFEKNGKYVYFSYNEPRYTEIHLDRSDPMFGFLYRTAAGEKDYTGGINHFTDWESLVPNVAALLN